MAADVHGGSVSESIGRGGTAHVPSLSHGGPTVTDKTRAISLIAAAALVFLGLLYGQADCRSDHGLVDVQRHPVGRWISRSVACPEQSPRAPRVRAAHDASAFSLGPVLSALGGTGGLTTLIVTLMRIKWRRTEERRRAFEEAFRREMQYELRIGAAEMHRDISECMRQSISHDLRDVRSSLFDLERRMTAVETLLQARWVHWRRNRR